MDIVTVDFTYPTIKIYGMKEEELNCINEYLHKYFLEMQFTEEDKQKFIENIFREVFTNNFSKEESDATDSRNVDSRIAESGIAQSSDITSISGVPIYNPDDRAEVAVKCNMTFGQIFKNLREAYNIVGLDNLGVKSLDGGKQKKTAFNTLSQYIELSKIEGKKQARQVTDIYEIPLIPEKEDGRGKGGYYMDRIIPIMINYLSNCSGSEIYCNVNELSKVMGIVGNRFKSITYKQLLDINPKFTHAMIQQFYYRCKPEQEEIVFKILDKLQNDCSVISYYKNYNIVTDDGISFTSSKDDDIIIRKIQRKILKEFKVMYISTIFQRRQEKRFYQRVCDLINQTYNLNWISYRQQIQIFVDVEELKEILPQFILDEAELYKNKKEVAERFSNRIAKRTLKDIEYTNSKADKQLEQWEIEANHDSTELKELMDLGFNYSKEIDRMKPTPFKYHDDYMDIQKGLIAILLSSEPLERVSNL